MRPNLTAADFIFALGMILLATGLGMIYFPLALVSVGLVLIAVGVIQAKREQAKREHGPII
jgi:hypothetical protein